MHLALPQVTAIGLFLTLTYNCAAKSRQELASLEEERVKLNASLEYYKTGAWNFKLVSFFSGFTLTSRFLEGITTIIKSFLLNTVVIVYKSSLL